MHSKLSFSSRARWTACPASKRMESLFPDQGDSTYALQGTKLHALLAARLAEHYHIDTETYTYPSLPEPEDFTTANCAYELFQRLIRDTFAPTPTPTADATLPERTLTIYVEQKVSLEHLHPDLRGTLDFAAYDPRSAHMLIADAKFGAKPVYAGTPEYPNPQLEAYALAMLATLGNPVLQKLTLAIVSPLSYGDRDVETLTLSVADGTLDIPAALTRITQEALKTDDPNAYPNPGKHCLYCRAKGAPSCAPYAQAVNRAHAPDTEAANLNRVHLDLLTLLHHTTAAARKLKANRPLAEYVSRLKQRVQEYADSREHCGLPPDKRFPIGAKGVLTPLTETEVAISQAAQAYNADLSRKAMSKLFEAGD